MKTYDKTAVSFAIFLSLILSFSGCSYKANSVIKKTYQKRLVYLPTQAVIDAELKGRAFLLSKVNGEFIVEGNKKMDVLPKEAYINLLQYQLNESFRNASLGVGLQPAYKVNIFIEKIELSERNLFVWDKEILQVRILITRPNDSIILQASIGCVDASNAPIWFAPAPSLVQHLSRDVLLGPRRLIPGVSVIITKILCGLKEGNALDKIEILQEDYLKLPPADKLLEENKWFIDILSTDEIERVTGTYLTDK